MYDPQDGEAKMGLVKAIAFGTVLLIGLAGCAQEYPLLEGGLDYTYARYVPSASYSQGHSLNGGGGSFVLNVNHYFGIKADLQGYGSSLMNFVIPAGHTNFPGGATARVQGNLFSFLFGPQFKLRIPKAQPFIHFLFGGAHSDVYTHAFNAICAPAGACGFSRTPGTNTLWGGGIDIPISRRISIRPAELDDLISNFDNHFNNEFQNSLRYSAGINFCLGAGKR